MSRLKDESRRRRCVCAEVRFALAIVCHFVALPKQGVLPNYCDSDCWCGFACECMPLRVCPCGSPYPAHGFAKGPAREVEEWTVMHGSKS